ncbi:MAG: FtsX-like permease family protein, partial [Planctomycetota bacterium]
PFRRLAPFAGLIAGRSIERGPTRIAASVAAISLVTAAFVGLRGMTRSLYLETDVWAREAVVDKVWVGWLPPNTRWRDVADGLAEYPGVRAVEVATHRITAPFRVVGAATDQLSAFGPLAEDPELADAFRDLRGMVVSRRLAKQRGLEVGDPVPIATPGSGVQTFRVIAISDAYGYHPNPHERGYGVVELRHLDRFFCLDTERADQLSVVLDPGADPGVVEAAVADLLGPQAVNSLRTGRELREIELSDIGRDFLVFDVILILTAVLAGVGVLNGQLLAAMERAKELGVLRALGADGRQIAGSVLLESTVIGLAGGLLGLLLGSALVPVIVRSLRVLSGLDLPQPGWTLGVALAPLAALAVAWLASLYPIWRMNRMDPVRAVRTG